MRRVHVGVDIHQVHHIGYRDILSKIFYGRPGPDEHESKELQVIYVEEVILIHFAAERLVEHNGSPQFVRRTVHRVVCEQSDEQLKVNWAFAPLIPIKVSGQSADPAHLRINMPPIVGVPPTLVLNDFIDSKQRKDAEQRAFDCHPDQKPIDHRDKREPDKQTEDEH